MLDSLKKGLGTVQLNSTTEQVMSNPPGCEWCIVAVIGNYPDL